MNRWIATAIVLIAMALLPSAAISSNNTNDGKLPESIAGKGIQLGPKKLLVDASLTDAQLKQSPYSFRTLQEAVKHLVAGTSADDRMTVYIAPGVYWLDDPDDPAIRSGENGRPPIALTIDCPWLQIIGLSDDPQDVILASNRGQTQGAIGNFTMLSFRGDGIHLENITLGNYCNVDLVYPRDPKQNRPRRGNAITQAQLAFANGDFLSADNCRFVSRLNTCPLNGGKRTIFTRCHFESTDDALEGRALYRQCSFYFHSGKPFYATSRAGAIILDSDFYLLGAKSTLKSSTYRQFFTKVSSPIMVANSRFHAEGNVSVEWTPYPAPTLLCYEQNLSLNDKPLTLKKSSPKQTVTLPEDPWKAIFHQLQTAPTDTLFNLLSILPIHQELSPSEMNITGDSTIHYKVLNYALGDRLLNTMEGPVGNAHNDTDTLQVQTVEKTSADGLQARAVINVRPTPLPSPTIVRKPIIRKKEKGLLQLDYELSLNGRADYSSVTWYRCNDELGTDTMPIAVSRLNQPQTTYRLQPGDENYYIMAKLEPRHIRSVTGEAITTILKKRISKKDILTPNVMETDFHDFPTQPQPIIAPGRWTLDGHKPEDTNAQSWRPVADSWFYGSGIDGHRGTGLLQKEKGARMLYTPTPLQLKKGAMGKETATNMSVTWLMDPGKTAGQGFGSATDQYLDIYIHYDAKTRSGYGIRIIRTTKHANAVDMMLMRFEEGRGEPLTEPVSTTCFLTNCTVHLWTSDGQLHAHVSTTTPQRESNLAREVNLCATIPTTTHYGIGLQHTGSVGASAIMLHHLKVEWGR
ncbi:MAG: hypothetical protein K5893_11415 [Prevotella sp.]|nr:hypothetical protein [Prevotella sp.]